MGDDGRRSRRTLIAIATAVVVVLVASLAVALTRGAGSGTNGSGFSIEAMAAAIEQQSVRLNATSVLPLEPAGDPHVRICGLDTHHCSSSRPTRPTRDAIVVTGLIDFGHHTARLDLATRTGHRRCSARSTRSIRSRSSAITT